MAPGPAGYFRFQQCLYLRDRAGRLIRVPWDSEWEKVGKGMQNQRVGVPDGRNEFSIFFPTLTNRRRATDPRRNPLRCELCHHLFADMHELAAHLPCRANQRMKVPGLRVRIELLRKGQWVRTTKIHWLLDILLDSLSEQAYRECLEEFSPLCSFRDPRRTEREDFEHYQLYRFASFVDSLRPGEIDWCAPSFSDMQMMRHLLLRFLNAPIGPQRKMLRQLLAGRVHLRTLAYPSRKETLRHDITAESE